MSTATGRSATTRVARALENCTLHNINFVPTTDGRDILVSGNYQAGTWVIDSTDHANPVTVGYADPPPLNPDAFSSGGAWSTHWYNGFMYESEITKGFHVFELDDEVVENAIELPYLNPQILGWWLAPRNRGPAGVIWA